MHEDELAIDEDLARRLLHAQFPEFSGLALSKLGTTGSSNVLFRLGDELLVRIPRQPGGGVSIVKEAEWPPKIGPQLPVRVPEVVAIGQPTKEYGEHWSITRWLEGECPRVDPTGDHNRPDTRTLASDLADVILALRDLDLSEEALADERLKSYRGMALAGFDNQMRINIEDCRAMEELDLDLDLALGIWEEALELPGGREPGVNRWYHGDLVAENLLLVDGKLSAVLDFGLLGIGDPTIDLVGAWEMLDLVGRDHFRERLGVDDAEWLRGRAWALGVGIGTLPYYWGKMPGRCRDRLVMIRAVLDDDRAR